MSNSVQPHRRQPTRLPLPGILKARALEWVATGMQGPRKPGSPPPASTLAGPLLLCHTQGLCTCWPLAVVSRSGSLHLLLPLPRIFLLHGAKWASPVAQLVKNPPAMRETWVRFLGREDPLEKGKATHPSILAWRIPWTV